MAHKQQERLIKKGQLDIYNEVIRKYIERGVIVDIPEHEKKSWQGPVKWC